MADRWGTFQAKEYALLVLLALLWGSSYLFIKIAVTEIAPLTLIAARVTIAALFLICVLMLQKQKLPSDWRNWRLLLVQAFFTSIGAWTLLAWGQQYIDSALASVLNSTSPIFVFFFTLLVTRHESTSVLRLFGAILGMLGVILIVGIDALAGLGQQVMGQVAALVGAMLYACAAIFGRRLSHLTATAAAAGSMLWASAVLIPLSLLIDQPWALSPSREALLATVALGLFCTGIALLIYFRLVQTLGSLGVASQAYLRTGWGVLLGIFILGEQITPIVGIGLAAAVLGVVAINMPSKSRG